MGKVYTIIFLILLSHLALGQIVLSEAFPSLSFNRPVDLQHPPDSSNRIFIVSQQGIIYSFNNDSAVSSAHSFLDIRDSVSRVDNELGLLGMAFHPDYQNNGFFYVSYNKKFDLRSIIARYTVSEENPDSAVINSQQILLNIEQPATNHNGGQIGFGPDGYLYIALGDGGGGGDTYGNGQNLQTLLGSILRINVDDTSNYGNYAIPQDNPFAGNTDYNREEIYAYGFRNPWRFSFDPVNGWLWVGDVGQRQWEEVNIVESGQNYGWNIMEGRHCYNAVSCDDTGLSYPVIEYSHALGLVITGGHVYRGEKVSALYGKYIYADFSSTRIWALEYDGINDPVNEELMISEKEISAFGIDQNYELYACAFDGKIYKFQSDPAVKIRTEKSGTRYTFSLNQNYPNPFNPITKINFQIPISSFVTLKIFDLSGHEISSLVNSYYAAGVNSINFDGSGLSSGIYFYQLQAGQFSQIKRMLLIK